MKYLKLLPFHSFLVIPYLCIFLYSRNVELVSFYMLFRTLFAGLILSILVFSISYLLLKKNLLKAGVFSTFILIMLFCYGLFYDGLEYLYWNNLWPFANIHRYLLLIYLMLVVLVFYWSYKATNTFLKLTPILNILTISLIIFNLLISFNTKRITTPPLKDTDCVNDSIISAVKNKPDVYYIILDGYASAQTLKQHYNDDNSEFIKFLRDSGFFVADSSFSNYYSTPPSLSATLNMNYHQKTDSISVHEKLKNNKVFSILHQLGYTIHVFKSGYTVSNKFLNVDEVIEIDGINEFERAILRYSICRLDDLFGYIPYIRIKSQFEKLKQYNTKQKSPKFLFAHIVCPHPPFAFDRNGNKKTKNSFGDNSWEPYEAYLEQLLYVNSQMKIVLSDLLKNYQNKEKPIIIVQADHGPYISNCDSTKIFNARKGILNAIYIADKNNLYKNISSVNTFRYIFKQTFNLPINLINDSTAGKLDFYNSPTFKKLLTHK